MWMERLGWTLVHFLWQGTLVATVYGIARWAARQSSANARYVLATAAMALMTLAPIATWTALGPPSPEQVVATFHAPWSGGSMPSVRDVPTQVLVSATRPEPSPALPWVVGLWFLGASVFSLRLFLAWGSVRTLSGTVAPPEWQARLWDLQRRIGVSRTVRLVVAPLADAPSVIGWLRPVVLTPVGALAGLPADQVEALLFHELAHIRRHDYLVNLAQSVVEALLFYHPAVWWISGHMRLERELCCDDLAVAMTGDPLTFARALAGVAASTRPVFTPAMAATGGPLAHRVARLLGHSRPAPRSAPGAGAAAGVIAVVVTAVALFAQPAEKPKFEAASVKPSTTTMFQMVRPQPGRLTADASLKVIMLNAYSLAPFQVQGLPAWAESDRYQIEAKAAGNATREQLFLMLQSLLEDRFQLRVHRETKEMPVLELVAAKSGLKLPRPQEGSCTPSPTDAPTPVAGGRMQPPSAGPPPKPYCGNMVVRLAAEGAQMAGGQVRMAELARMLSMAMGRAVIDRTGYTDSFDAQVDFLPDQSTSSLPPPPPGSPPLDNPKPSITTAIQEQLGLRLQSGKGPVDLLVVDRVERPSAN
jgi:uncharacterized protein (TIGR03435 family)